MTWYVRSEYVLCNISEFQVVITGCAYRWQLCMTSLEMGVFPATIAAALITCSPTSQWLCRGHLYVLQKNGEKLTGFPSYLVIYIHLIHMYDIQLELPRSHESINVTMRKI